MKSNLLLGNKFNLRTYALDLKYGGGRGIRTPAGFNTPVGFQDRSLQPGLGIPPYQQEIIYHDIKYSVNGFIFIKTENDF